MTKFFTSDNIFSRFYLTPTFFPDKVSRLLPILIGLVLNLKTMNKEIVFISFIEAKLFKKKFMPSA